jgi:hypothetical protein
METVPECPENTPQKSEPPDDTPSESEAPLEEQDVLHPHRTELEILKKQCLGKYRSPRWKPDMLNVK